MNPVAHTPAPTISTWIYVEAPGEESQYPQIVGHGAASSDRFQAVYWRCVAVFFATAARWSPDARRVLFTNAGAVPAVDGRPVGPLLDRLGVEVVRLGYTFQPPEGYFGAWRNQFYVFDIVRWLARDLEADDATALDMDSDCLWARPAGRMAAMARRHGALTYDLGLPEDAHQNGLTPREMGALYGEIGPAFGAAAPDAVPPYLGGEVIAATGAMLRGMDALLDPLWDEMLRRHRDGRATFYEEAQALSFVYHVLGVAYGTANPYVRRIWTTLLKGDDARAPDLDLAVWHLPGEKRYGLGRLFEDVFEDGGPFWSLEGDAWRRWAGAKLGVRGRSLRKTVRDVPVAVRDKVRAWAGR